ncbi:MFS transporter [Streptomyces sp. Je 1-79]|uniref:MFS transporter n=1 Tax=Streptomyces sp. Je 1-79 TaxID=2943847 RepID=UPI0021A6D672|nr:MFS transporter [Streptomyces sp. Je 1-79]MCT4356303.1 MFS transporter [Streptomyces sp. Je 1-79]
MTTAEPTRADEGAPTRASVPTRINLPTPRRPAPPSPTSRPRRRRRRYPVMIATGVAALTHVLWFFLFANSGGDLAAQDAWAEFVGRHPDSAYNLAWYGGMHPVSYSVVSPYVMSVLGVRTTMMIAGTVSAGLTALILVRVRAVRNPLACSLAGVFAFLCNALSGRVTFGLGMMFALGAVAAVFCWPYRWRHRRWAKAAVAAPFAGVATACSPVAGLFLGVAAAALFLNRRRPGAYALGLAPVLVVALSSWLFPFSGTQPMSWASTALPFLFGVLCFLLVPREWRTVRTGAAVYSAGTLLTWLIDSQIGSNVSRLVMLFAGVVLLAALPYAVPRSRKWYAVVVAFAGLNVWIGFKGVDDVIRTAPDASWAREVAPLINQLQVRGAEKARVEVVPASSHRESSALSPYINLARGWNRQADMERNPLFYDDTLNATNYQDWLDRWAVHYVVLPTGAPDSGAEVEAELVGDGLPYLKQVWSDANWRLYEVQDPTPLADPPAEVRRAGANEVVIEVDSPGRVLIRVPYSPWLALVDEHGGKIEPPEETEASKAAREASPAELEKVFLNESGCLLKTEADADGDEWTELVAPKAGVYTLSAPYKFFPRGTACPEELR